MVHKAEVVFSRGALMARVLRPEACQSCRSCELGTRKELLVPLPEGANAKEGDVIELELPEGSVGRAALLAYALPALALVAGVWLGEALGARVGLSGDACGAALGLALAALCYGLLKHWEPRLRASGRFLPRCGAQIEEEKDNERNDS